MLENFIAVLVAAAIAVAAGAVNFGVTWCARNESKTKLSQQRRSKMKRSTGLGHFRRPSD
jgi:hypothetical protein